MILKKLIAHGFKSFADRTEFEFDHGITAIVGPNGCGKSNVVDAIRWVLGEQSAKSLRGKQMMDVIFNGSGTRRTSGMAQVDLVFDNSDGKLPLDQTEVVVTRRLFRSGESEYLLNRQSCRLKDVKELFMDTGIGVDAYSVIEQGRVDALLQANPLERRTIFEEAAGISKFKARKKEALRKLERVQQNLLRLQDIIDELEKRLRSIKLAAGKARSFQEYNTRLRELKSRYSLAAWHELRQSQQRLEREAAQFSDQCTALRTQLSESETLSSQAQTAANALERDISENDGRLLTAQSQISAHEERIRAGRQRIVERGEALERTRRRVAALLEQTEALRAQIAATEERRADADAEFSSLQARVGDMQSQERALSAELASGRHAVEDEKNGIVELLRRTAALGNEIQNLGQHQTTLATQKDRLAARSDEILQHLTQQQLRRSGLDHRRGEILKLLDDHTRAAGETASRAAAVAGRRSQLREQVAAAKEYRSGLQSRLHTLEELDRRREGLAAGVREVLARRDAGADGDASGASADAAARGAGGAFAYVLGPVGELFEADVRHASLIEAVLGDLEQHLVVASRDALLADRESLAKIEGRVPAFCLDQTPAPIAPPDLTGQPGFVACALDWVRVPPACERLARYLLGRTFVVETIDDARRLAESTPPGLRFVTLEGVVWESDGRLALGSLGAGTGVISRRSELRGLHDQIAEVEARIADLAGQLQSADAEAAHLEQVQNDLRAALSTVQNERVETDTLLSRLDEELARLSREQPLIASEAEAVAAQMREATERRERSRSELAELEAASTQRHQRVEAMQAELAQGAERLRVLAEQTTQARVAAGEAGQRRAALIESLAAQQASLAASGQESSAAERECGDIAAAIEQTEQDLIDWQSQLDRLRLDHERCTRESAALRGRREQHLLALEEQSHEQRRLRGELDGAEAEHHERQMKLGEVRVRMEDLRARTQEDLGVDLAEQYTGEAPAAEDWSAVEAEIEELRGKIDRLGNVNMDAIAEQEELEKRHGFLTGQRDDLRESERQLTALITRLDDDSKSRFATTFEEVRNHFGELFRKLFGGGKADIILQDMNDVLECGIDIVARPPGKELQNIALMSGGEKTMTAIALLMAVFRTRPSPFTLLDEVDAALDEANNERFNRVLREFLDYSQFIIITHSKRTMSIADVLYGVTMQEAGVSKRVAVRLEDDRADEPQAAVA